MAMKRTHSEMAPSPDDAPSGQGLQDDGPPVKRQLVARSQVEDAGDRAMTYRKAEQFRVQLKEIGFWPNNRGRLGISSQHCHAVAWDCIANMTKLQRYAHVALAEIPPEMRESILAANREQCESDPLMPRFSPDMKYVCASNTHFTHAQKLFYDSMFGCPHYLFNDAKNLVIKLQDGDVECKEILSSGVMAVIYGPELLRDEDAMCAFASADNLNASVQMVEDEMQAFGRVHALVDRLAPGQEKKDSTINSLISQLEVSGIGTFTRENWKDIITLRFSMPGHMAKLFMTCQFDACAGRVRVKPADFGQSARLDPRAPFGMCATMLSQFLGTPIKHFPRAAGSGSFEGLRPTFAPKLSAAVINELTQEHEFILEVESFIKQVLITYPGATQLKGVAASELRQERCQLLAACGKCIMSVGQLIETEVRKAAAIRRTLSQDARIRFVNETKKGKLSKIEEHFRSQLVKRKLYTQENLPNAVEPPTKTSSQVAPSQEPELKLKEKTLGSITSEGRALTNDDVFTRLEIKGLGEEVLALVPCVKLEKEEEASDTDEPTNDAPTKVEQTKDGTRIDGRIWQIVTLTSLEIPNALVKYAKDKAHTTHSYQVLVDELRPVPKSIKEPEVNAPHPTRQSGGVALNGYDYEACEMDSTKFMLHHLIMSLHVRSINSVECVKVYKLNEHGGLPIILQAQATRAFKKGQLTLSPLGTIMADTDFDQHWQRYHQPRLGVVKAHQGPGRKVIHWSMMKYVKVTASLTNDKRKASTAAAAATHYYVINPLMAQLQAVSGWDRPARESCLQNISPFWAVLGCADHKSSHNVELQVTTFRHQGFDATSARFPRLPPGTRFQGEVPIIRNVCAIEKNEVLCMPRLKDE